eukprot:1356775-Amorphochlora_amoeboformis.AAC.1
MSHGAAIKAHSIPPFRLHGLKQPHSQRRFGILGFRGPSIIFLREAPILVPARGGGGGFGVGECRE